MNFISQYAPEIQTAAAMVQAVSGGWPTLPRGTGPYPITIETRGVPDPFALRRVRVLTCALESSPSPTTPSQKCESHGALRYDRTISISPTRNKPLTQRACFTLDLCVLMR